jgi:hypothetical protein
MRIQQQSKKKHRNRHVIPTETKGRADNMKKTIALIITIVLLAACASALADGPRFVTVNEWLDTKGECGDCYLVVQVQAVLNPVLAVVADETGSVNLYSGGETDLLFDFSDHEDAAYYRRWIFVISNPEYNEFEGVPELKNWTLERFMPSIAD